MAGEFLRGSAAHLNPVAVTIQRSNDRDTGTESGMAPRFATDTPARETRSECAAQRRAEIRGKVQTLGCGESDAIATRRERLGDLARLKRLSVFRVQIKPLWLQ